ncbi:hypothetical protein AWH48_16490 [Domibacillus aminovorans]|uniref:Bacterial Ig-like domain-containing protein n=1 Tax=Domibacillus aminovorans TaxID=29332 RepID=A0A177KZ32_9BACI|nr:immunoglobulin-like domain-containing protein [Domibacillus aminovorans]OAH58603.1 hypothetical protein AWH48_16490 [Domibacillus aminovorans]
MNKHIMLFHFFLITVFLLAACQFNEGKTTATADEKWTKKAPIQHIAQSQNGVLLNMKKKRYMMSEKEIKITILNESKFELTHGEPFAIEKNINGIWYSVPFKTNAFETGSFSLHPSESFVQNVYLDPYLENDLPPGKYRLVKFFGELLDSKSGTKKNKLILAVPFKVVN